MNSSSLVADTNLRVTVTLDYCYLRRSGTHLTGVDLYSQLAAQCILDIEKAQSVMPFSEALDLCIDTIKGYVQGNLRDEECDAIMRFFRATRRNLALDQFFMK